MATVAIVDYDPSWPDQFERAGYLATPTGTTTSPPATGATLDGGRSACGRARPAPAANVHVRVAGWPNQRYALLFRDDLRAHPAAAAAYARRKRGLAERFGGDLAAYTDLKDSACDLIVVAAEAWAAAGRE
jgi:GrpB-like predicted nucleotidyltransferase (UPF0157 family)